MSFVEVRDHAMWVEHIHGNKSLQERILGMEEGDTIELRVEGVHGIWRKMNNRVDGTPTPGIEATGAARSSWHELRNERRGGIVTVEVCD